MFSKIETRKLDIKNEVVENYKNVVLAFEQYLFSSPAKGIYKVRHDSRRLSKSIQW